MKKLIMMALLLPLILMWGCTKKESGEENWTGDLIVNGSFEEVEGNQIIGWENVDTLNISHDVPEGGGNNSLILITGDILVEASQSMEVPMNAEDYSFSCYAKTEITGGEGFSKIQISVNEGDSVRVVWEKTLTSDEWTQVTKEGLSLEKGKTVKVSLIASGGIDSSIHAEFDLVELKR